MLLKFIYKQNDSIRNSVISHFYCSGDLSGEILCAITLSTVHSVNVIIESTLGWHYTECSLLISKHYMGPAAALELGILFQHIGQGAPSPPILKLSLCNRLNF